MIVAKKSLGQNFLIDQNTINKIVNSINISDEKIIEIVSDAVSGEDLDSGKHIQRKHKTYWWNAYLLPPVKELLWVKCLSEKDLI